MTVLLGTSAKIPTAMVSMSAGLKRSSLLVPLMLTVKLVKLARSKVKLGAPLRKVFASRVVLLTQIAMQQPVRLAQTPTATAPMFASLVSSPTALALLVMHARPPVTVQVA